MKSTRLIVAVAALILAFCFLTPTYAFAALTESFNASDVISQAYADDETDLKEDEEADTEDYEPENTSSAKPLKNGVYNINGKKVYYINGEMQTGFVKLKSGTYFFNQFGYMVKGLKKIGNWRYYFNSGGKMLTGIRKIKKDYYCFSSDGKMQTGVIRKNGKTYYYDEKSGKRQYGLKKIGKYTFFFKKKSGAAITGLAVRKYKGKKFDVFFDKFGRLKTGVFTAEKVRYKATKKLGKIYSRENLAKAICQLPELPTGCEITSWTMMTNYAGVKISKKKAAAVMPKSGNPNLGFMGSPYMASGDGLVVFPNGLKSITKKYLGSYTNLTHCSFTALKNKLGEQKLVLVWVYGLGFNWSHTVALTGYDREGFFYNDPYTGKKAKISYSSFRVKWSANGCMAMSY